MFALHPMFLAELANQGMLVAWLGIMLIMFLVGVLGTIFWVWMLIDAIKNRALTDTEKIVWVLLVVFLHFLGALLYFLLARDKRGARRRT